MSRLTGTGVRSPAALDRRAFCRGTALAGLGLWLGGCERAPSAPRLLGASDLGAAERRYGMAPAEADLRYQPDVVRVRGGASSILDMGRDGLTWAVDAGAPGAGRLRPGAIALITNRCAGRVLALRRAGDALVMVLGPAELTDYIRDCDLELEQSLDLGRAVTESAPELPGTRMQLVPTAPWSEPAVDDELARLEALPQLRAPALAWPAAGGDALPLRLGVIPQAGPDGIGIRTAASNGLVNIEFVARLRLQSPRVELRLKIGAGKVREASLRLSGAAGLRLGFIATSEGDYTANIDSKGQLVPMALSLPMMLDVGSPLSLSLQQRFLVRSAFSARQSVLKAIGDYGLAGDLHFGYRDGRFGSLGGPAIQTVNSSMVDGMRGISVGVSGMVLSHQVRLLAGIGGLGFRAGPYVALTTATGVSHGSSLARPVQPNVCRAATLTMHVAPGIGWQIPQLIADGVNAILGLLRLRKVQSAGGAHSSGRQVFKRTAFAPDTAFCREAAGGGPAGGTRGADGAPGKGGGPPPPEPSPRRPKPAPAAPEPPATSPLDLGRACGQPDVRRRLEQAGLDLRLACRGTGDPT